MKVYDVLIIARDGTVLDRRRYGDKPIEINEDMFGGLIYAIVRMSRAVGAGEVELIRTSNLTIATKLVGDYILMVVADRGAGEGEVEAFMKGLTTFVEGAGDLLSKAYESRLTSHEILKEGIDGVARAHTSAESRSRTAGDVAMERAVCNHCGGAMSADELAERMSGARGEAERAALREVEEYLDKQRRFETSGELRGLLGKIRRLVSGR